MAEIKCPMCGRPNPEELDVCQFCEAQLKSITDELSRSQPPIKPGDDPRKVDTGELEPVLPQWLRDVRQQARDAAEDSEVSDQPGAREESTTEPREEKKEAAETPIDLLAGLASQSDDVEDVPDWLANIRDEDTPENDLPDMMADLQQDDEVPQTGELGGITSSAWDSTEGETIDTFPDQDQSVNFGSFDAPLPDSVNDASLTDSGELPDWLKTMGADGISQEDELIPATFPTEESAEPTREEPEVPMFEDDTPDWLAELGGGKTSKTDATPPIEELAPIPGEEASTPDWLVNLSSDDTVKSEPGINAQEPVHPVDNGDMPDWLAELGGDEPAKAEPTPEPEEHAQPSEEEREISDWLSSLRGDEPAETETTPEPEEHTQPSEEEGDTPDWLSSLGGEEPAETETTPETEEHAQPSEEEGETTDWFSSLGGEEPAETEFTPETEEHAQSSEEEGETPDWLSSLGDEEPAEAEITPKAEEPLRPSEEEGKTLYWLSSLGDEEPAEAETIPEPEEPFQPTGAADTPDWLESLGRESQAEDDASEPITPPFAERVQKPVTEEEQPAAPVIDEEAPIVSGDMDAIFSMEMPDWLEDVGSKEQTTEAEIDEATVTSEDDLSPASLPSWVQAMRPVESVISETQESDDDQGIEETGPLAGLAGVLPPMPGFSPSSKPKTYSLKLAANEEQQENADLLERLLASEAHPLPIKSQVQILSQRMLRWLITIVMVILIGGVVFSGTQFLPMPVGMPQEAWTAIQIVEGVPENAPVLLIFDYDAALAGELEVAAAGLIDHMLLLKHPRLTLLASKPIGTGLAERFMAVTQSGHNYLDSQQILNLGYLPGGAAGVLGFAKNPKLTMPVAANGSPAWQSPTLQGVNSIADFSAVIFLSDDAESARIWIEQLEADNSLDNTNFIVVSSGQSGPMILPYVQSGQVSGIVIGLDNGASIEQYNAGRTGLARTYWDAYGFGLLAAVAIIILGSIWNLIPAWQTSRTHNNGEG